MNPEFPSWSFEIGDPTFVGWFTVFAYFVTAFLSFKVSSRSHILFPQHEIFKQSIFWFVFALIFLFLGFNKQLDLQSYFTAIAKYYAKRDGWYDVRRMYQKQFILFIISFLCITLCMLFFYFKKIILKNRYAVIGLILLFAFIAIRASSFHKMDLLINYEVLNLRLNWIFELTGVFLVFFAAKSHLKQSSAINN